MSSGGPGSGLFRSTDGGESWTEITRNPGLPQEGLIGKIGVAVSPVDPDRVFAIVENEEGGVFRSDDGGETWERTNDERKLRQRAFYYTRIYADPQDEDRVYVLNTAFYRSDDAGETFGRTLRVPHGDNHDLWIAPSDPDRMINGNDGGANVLRRPAGQQHGVRRSPGMGTSLCPGAAFLFRRGLRERIYRPPP
jgi:photosystem II stability/assembly factor-like uncharacterized protein